MSNAISINIGLNYVDSTAYGGWKGELSGCVNDAVAMRAIADGLGYQSVLVLNEEATADRVIAEIGQAAWNMEENGILLLSFSGHGGQMPDINGDEIDALDETWLMYDRQLIDDELYNLWDHFGRGTRILVVSDSCHSGTVTKNREYAALAESDALKKHYRAPAGGHPRFRGAPARVAAENYEQHKSLYSAIQFASGRRKRSLMEVSVLLLSGCQDNQLSSDGDVNGLFTEKLLKTWNDGQFSGSYKAFHHAILSQMPSTQTPNYSLEGAGDPAFEAQTPFAIGMPSAAVAPASWPTIRGPATVERDGTPPSFSVNAGPGRFFAVEVASSPDLFDIARHGNERNADNFYGSWSDGALMKGSSYTLSPAIWDRLRVDGWLYYRVGSTTSPNTWNDYLVSSGDTDGGSIPAIQITA